MGTYKITFSMNLLVGLVLFFLLFPVLVVVAISFSSAEFLTFPPPGLSLRWYEEIFSSYDWVNAFWITIKVGLLTALISVVLGVPAAFAIIRHSFFGKDMFNALILAALITPPIIKAMSIYLFYVELGLNNTIFGLALAHTVSGVPFVVINTAASLKSYDVNLERAACVHGASPLRSVLVITLPVIWAGVLVGAVFAFMQSAQELIVSIFVLGTVNRPLAVKLWEGVQVSTDPSIAAASTVLIGVAILSFLMVVLIKRRDGSLAP